jgi:hypothetical protein
LQTRTSLGIFNECVKNAYLKSPRCKRGLVWIFNECVKNAYLKSPRCKRGLVWVWLAGTPTKDRIGWRGKWLTANYFLSSWLRQGLQRKSFLLSRIRKQKDWSAKPGSHCN